MAVRLRPTGTSAARTDLRHGAGRGHRAAREQARAARRQRHATLKAHHAYVFANRRADRFKVLVYDGAGLWLCTRRLQAGSFAWPRRDTGAHPLTREQFDWLVAGLPWQRLSAPPPQAITVV